MSSWNKEEKTALYQKNRDLLLPTPTAQVSNGPSEKGKNTIRILKVVESFFSEIKTKKSRRYQICISIITANLEHSWLFAPNFWAQPHPLTQLLSHRKILHGKMHLLFIKVYISFPPENHSMNGFSLQLYHINSSGVLFQHPTLILHNCMYT